MSYCEYVTNILRTFEHNRIVSKQNGELFTYINFISVHFLVINAHNKLFEMPVVFLERLPLPSLRLYTSISVVLLSLAVYYASHMEHNFHQQTSFVSTTTKETHIPISEDNNRKEILGDKLNIQELHGDVSTDEAQAVPNENEKVITTTTSSNNKLNVEFQHILSDNNELFATNETVQILKNDFLESSDRDDNAEGHIIESTESDVQNHQESLMTPRDYIVNGENMDDDSPYLLRLVYSLLSEGWCIWVSFRLDT